MYAISRTREAARVRCREEHLDGVDRGWEKTQGERIQGKLLCLVLLAG